ncbi:hypothetical protein GGR51DRAFT_576165 [Nemania sp. FL0031]|nr:hypothetical protein GGR51DRAFT_576165 [Nemania sp. FL0031]
MANRSAGLSCLSIDPHDQNITNPLLHFHGCIEIWERDAFLEGKVDIWEEELKHQNKFLNPQDAKTKVDRMKESWRSNFEGRYLLAAAHLHEAMTTYKDRRLLKKYLAKDPPIHPRRTLDQAYYWTLESTKKRDKDQVLYRGTTVNGDNFHRHSKKGTEILEKDCLICRNNIRMISRVVMVDQLWMWVLDAKTLITCFPKRYGANRQDYSGVHKSIRAGLEDLDSNQIRTVFELGLIVLDKCTTTFFSRTKSLDRRPQVIDEFSKAIGNIMHNQTLAFDQLWRWTDKARIIYQSPGRHNTKGRHISLLDINPEGKLDREIGDIIEELDIMLRISNIHQDIVKRYIEQAERALDPDADFRKIFEHSPQKARVPEPGREEAYQDYESFKVRGNECQDKINRQVKDLESLRQSAKNTADGVLHLLTMKQQQAGVDQAWQAVKQTSDLCRVVFVSFVFAFSSWIRVWIWSFYARASTRIWTKTGIFTFFDERKKVGSILEETNAMIDEMKIKARDLASLKKKLRRECEKRREGERLRQARGGDAV